MHLRCADKDCTRKNRLPLSFSVSSRKPHSSCSSQTFLTPQLFWVVSGVFVLISDYQTLCRSVRFHLSNGPRAWEESSQRFRRGSPMRDCDHDNASLCSQSRG